MITCAVEVNDNSIATASTDRTTKVWNIQTSECLHTVHLRGTFVLSMLKLKSDPSHVLCKLQKRGLEMRTINMRQSVFLLNNGEPILSFCEVMNGTLLTLHRQQLKLWNIRNNTCLETINYKQCDGPLGRVQSIEKMYGLDDMKTVVLISLLENIINLWDVTTRQVLHSLRLLYNNVPLHSCVECTMTEVLHDDTLAFQVNIQTKHASALCLWNKKSASKAVSCITVNDATIYTMSSLKDGSLVLGGFRSSGGGGLLAICKVWNNLVGLCCQTISKTFSKEQIASILPPELSELCSKLY
eukprot:TRINITY_DN13150_c0_g1_i1.p1 TRINITY_DN13150_c0_g1~~TRINITY_DN13150_c0_g1_i1.p1  ORF type:complete len:299 (-),score=44.16 TRINITY_DN13150_c0_g1_i1:100-996(-)